MKRRPIRKRSFLLLELILCFALIAVVLLPLLKPHLHLYRVQLKQTVEIEMQRLSKLALCELKQNLYETPYSFQQLVANEKLYPALKSQTFYLDKKEIPITCTCTLGLPQKKPAKTGKKAILRTAQITLTHAQTQKHYTYPILFKVIQSQGEEA